MPLDVPILDDTAYEELVATARSRFVTGSPEWTDHNVHDPGVTIVELLAWLTETYTYQLDRLTDVHRRKYLALLGTRPHPPQPATVTLQLDPATAGAELTPGATLVVDPLDEEHDASEPGTATALFFELLPPGGDGADGGATGTSVTPTTAALTSVVSDYDGGRTDNTATNGTDGVSYLAFGPEAGRRSALYLGFDADPFDGDTARTLSLDVALDDAGRRPIGEHGDEPTRFEPTVDVAWEYCVDYAQWFLDDAWEPLDVVADGTTEFYESGLVVLGAPATGTTAGTLFDTPEHEPSHWLRCIVRVAGHETPPRVDTLSINAVRARHRRQVTDETLRRTDGRTETTAHPDQTFEFEHWPVLDATVTVDGEPWERVDDFDGAAPDARVYVLDPATGTVQFGDDVAGGVPPAGAVVRATYHYGGGTAGNGHRTAAWRFADDGYRDVVVRPLAPATGGADAETVTDALDRLRRDLRTPYRTVTRDDYSYIAIQTPGVRVARAEAFVDNVETDDCEPSGIVRVVVVPDSTRPRPDPSAGLLSAVSCHLRRHSLLTDRVSVEPPAYTGVGVVAEIDLEPSYTASERVAAVIERLDEFLDPLSGYEGDGWPLGRPVHRAEVYEAIEDVAGVDCVRSLRLTVTGSGEVDTDGDVVLGGTGLPYPTTHDVHVALDPDQCGREFR
jgi:predicted phage baseplate assembly protein